MLEGARSGPAAARPLGDERLRHRERPHHHGYEVATQPTQGAHPFVPVDHHEAACFGHHHDRDLLPALGQCAEKAPLRVVAPSTQSFEPQVELVELRSHGLARGWLSLDLVFSLG